MRESAFTVLNRLAALKLMEHPSRSLIPESVGRGKDSKGFSLFQRISPEVCRSARNGQVLDGGFRLYLESIFDDLADELGVLFDRRLPQSIIFPSEACLKQLLDLLNGPAITNAWSSDETSGWIYQYFTPKELRDKARKESPTPRNSYELAFRNQFYTPRYVVEFLVANTFGRLWYEMTGSALPLASHLVRQVEIDGETGTRTPGGQNDNLDLPFPAAGRTKKDPRDLKILDPACGSGHFLLHVFDLLEAIYLEAWQAGDFPPSEQSGRTLREDYADAGSLRRGVPGLILAHNLYGVDIDLRATQIAALALWLRAQRSYQEQGLRVPARLRIVRSNIVCAEPMPGEKELLEEFVVSLKPRLLGHLVRTVFQKMALAGEAGTLIRVEEDIRDVVSQAKSQWLSGPKPEQLLLFPVEQTPASRLTMFDVRDVTDESFWDEAEARVLEALRIYATTAANGRTYVRRLFAEDAVQGFSFVDLCRRRFDVILMNPPFGDYPTSLSSLAESSYDATKRDIYAMFVQRASEMRAPGGFVGAILPRTGLFIGTMGNLRSDFLLERLSLYVLVDLGKNVLDEATVRTACFCLGGPVEQDVLVFRIGNVDARSDKLKVLIERANGGHLMEDAFLRSRRHFRLFPSAALAYWIPPRLAERFGSLLPLSEIADVRQGIATGDNFRFLRLFTELPDDHRDYRPYSKGGEPLEYFDDLGLYVYWADDGKQIKDRAAQEYGSASRTVKNEETFGIPGITYSQVNDARLKFRLHPRNAIYDMKGPVVFPREGVDLWALLGFLNSSAVEDLMRMATDGRQWHPTALKQIPVPRLEGDVAVALATVARDAVQLRVECLVFDEAGHFFTSPCREPLADPSASLDAVQAQVDELVWKAYGAEAEEVSSLRRQRELFLERTFEQTIKRKATASDFVHYAVGASFGRWDVTAKTLDGMRQTSSEDLFALPTVARGVLVGSGGRPARAGEVGAEYPVLIDWDGILVDDPGHPDDIVARVRASLEVVAPGRASEIEKAVCESFGVNELRDYFRNPKGFFEEHVSRYSRSRRKAPIYWLLQTERRSYALWLYYHRIDRDTLFKALRNYVEPKIKGEFSRLTELKQRLDDGREALPRRERSKLEKEIERQDALLGELGTFNERLERVAVLGYEPDLDDGVVLNIAPFHELMPWKEARAYWEELIEGKHPWSTIAKRLREREVAGPSPGRSAGHG